MPLQNADYRNYPKGWMQFSLSLRAGRAIHRCECRGECGQHTGTRCLEVNKQKAHFFCGRVVLSCAHSCNCYPLCANPDHIIVMCQKCHLRFDRHRHAAARLRTQATPTYKAQRYRRQAKELHFENLAELVHLPKKKRNGMWFKPPWLKQASPNAQKEIKSKT
jgi:hypothetical protein